MEYKDYYRILGVPKTADEAEIKRAYRKLARQHHPDRNPGNQKAEDRLKDINEAYEVLGDAQKRRKYDQLGTRYQDWQRRGGDPSSFDWGQPGSVRVEDLNDLFGGGSFSDFFNTIFGGGGRRPGARARGQDIEQNVEVTLEEAFHGATITLSKNGKTLEVKIPRGVKTGSKVRVNGEGGSALGDGPKGDLFLVITVRPHERYRREGDDLTVELPVDLYTAVLGGEARVPTLDGALSLKIPPETQTGRTFKLRGQGMPSLRDPNSRGDLLVKVHVRIPSNLTPEEKKLFADLARLRAH